MLKLFIATTFALVLTGCASLNSVDSEVQTFGFWPAGRAPAGFVFERLPSQLATPDNQQHQQMLEDAARGPIEAAGFRAEADPAGAEYLVQLGARIELANPWIYNEPLFWNGGWRYNGFGNWGRRGFGPGPYWGGHGYWGPGWGPYYDTPTYDREVALLIRDNKTGKLLYETRAASTGFTDSIGFLLPAMFQAAMQGFPNPVPSTRSVTTPIRPVASPAAPAGTLSKAP